MISYYILLPPGAGPGVCTAGGWAGVCQGTARGAAAEAQASEYYPVNTSSKLLVTRKK